MSALLGKEPARRRGWRRAGAIAWRAAVWLVFLTMLAAGVIAAYLWWMRPQPTAAKEIFHGIVYECRQLPETPETSGLAHLFRIDLTTPGMELYVTPVDKKARAAGWEYQTRWAPGMAKEAGVSVLVNGPLFGAQWGSRGLPGDWSRTLETLISEHEVNHVWEHTYLLWFEDDLTPHMEESKPPPAEALAKARWAVGSQIVWYSYGRFNPFAGHEQNRRTAVGIDAEKKLLFIGVFDSISGAAAAQILAEFGAKQVMPLDGGSSTSLGIGEGARDVRTGTYVYPWRTLPTFFGVRAPAR